MGLPSRCALCGSIASNPLCNACDESYWNETRLRCPRCALPVAPQRAGACAPQAPCEYCSANRPAFDATIALADYAPPLDQLAIDLKFHARLALARDFAMRLADAAETAFDRIDGRPDLIVPVPLSRKRLAARGYNQAWQIARPLARALDTRAAADLVSRRRDTLPQADLDASDRRANVASAFALDGTVAALHVGIVDDVMTSGATLDALARLLKTAGARRVTNFVVLRTPRS
jgi:ComF family protein